MTEVSFQVTGTPRPGGSKRAFAVRRGGVPTGRTVVADTNPRAKPWRALVIAAALDAIDGRPGFPLTGPLELQVEFTLARPISHFGSGRNRHRLRPSAPAFPAVRPDVTKLLRPLEDALTRLVWADDAQIVVQRATKTYGLVEGARVRVRMIEGGAL